MKNKLSSIAVQYRKFSKGQYIGPDQFNEFLDFFEDQDRLSRMLLQGVGIVCGLKSKLIYTNRLLSSIQLSQGAALTTDGDVLTLNNTGEVSKDLYISDLKTINIESKNYTHFKVYDNFKIRYPSFYDGDHQIDLWELATAEEAKTDFQSIANLSDLEDKYLLLYLEDYEKEVKPCRGVDCDNHGILQIRNLKVLVTTAKGITNILGDDRLIFDPITGISKKSRKDRIQPHALFLEGVLGPVGPQRVVMSQFVSETGVDKRYSVTDLKKLYSDALIKYGYGQVIFDKIVAISQVMGLPEIYTYQIFKDNVIKCLAMDAGFQYAYDAVKDLMDTYSEIIKLLPQAFTKNFPDFDSFPKHIMLGKLTLDNQLDSSRHRFYNSPVLDDKKATQRLKELVNRFNQQALGFRYSGSKKEIKITSSQKLNPLSHKAIPFYYEVTEGFLKTWNFDKTSHRSSTDNVRYDLAFLSSDNSMQGPVNFSADKSSFYNIEGHQGMDYQVAFEQIKNIRDKQQLGFDIVALSLEELVHNKDFSKAYFNEYLEENPGLEHRHGVERAGTFLMVYDSVQNPKVIADFSLPYICCTPKSKIDLSLPMTEACIGSDPIPFTVSPINGVVKAVVDEKLDGGVREINGVYFFNPGLVSPQLWGQEITFTVNGKSTNCSIKVTSQPNIKAEVASVVYPGGDSVATTVNIKVSGQKFADYSYSWDFLGNDVWVPLNPDTNGYVSYKYSSIDPKNIPVIRVRVSNGGCTQEIIIRDWYTAPVQLSLRTNVLCSVSDPIPFTVSPANGVVAGNGVVLNGGQYSFDPHAVDPSLHGQAITFTVNGQSTNCTIKVIPPPKVDVKYTVNYPTGSSTEVTVNIEVSGPFFTEYAYDWDFLGNGHFTTEYPVGGKITYKYSNVDPKNIPVIGVKVSGGGCNQDIFIRDWYNAPVQLSLRTNVLCSVSDPIPFTVSPANGVVAGNGVVLNGGQYSFDPHAVDPSLHGQIITFTVNGKPTNCTIKVIPPPKVDVKYTVNYPTGNSTEVTVNIDVSGPFFTEYVYDWDFLGNGHFTTQYPVGGKVTYKYSNVDPKNIPVIAVKVSGGGCNQDIYIRDWYKPATLVINNIDFSEGVSCCEGVKPVVVVEVKDIKARVADRFFVLEGSATGDESTNLLYSWLQISGPSVAVLTFDVEKPILKVANLAVGLYKFRFIVFDANSEAFDFRETSVNVS